jgi:2-polyprenyl-3-methyl-5-hydroxy-6-metoxy-1,4-benzoquinol methylase
VKIERQQTGGYFEQPLIVLLNRACNQLINSDSSCQKILEVGSGTGIFAYEAAQKNGRQIVASEFNDGARSWAEANRNCDNLTYCKLPLSEFSKNEFDVIVSIEVIEHIYDYHSFLLELSSVAPKAIITTPNKNRNPFDSIINTPAYGEHCREWTAGEFYWVLRTFYKQVFLYSLPNLDHQIKRFLESPDSYVPLMSSVGVLSKEHILIAKCEEPCFVV